MENVTFTKNGTEYTLHISKNGSTTLSTANLVRVSGKVTTTVETVYCKYSEIDGKITFSESNYIKIGEKMYAGIMVTDEAKQRIHVAIEKNRAYQEAEKQDRQNCRVSPEVSQEEYIIYGYGCDSGRLIHEKPAVVEKAIQNGAKVSRLFRGERDDTNKYPCMMDSYIPESYVANENGKFVAVGYKYVSHELLCISQEDFHTAQAQINTIKLEREARRDAKNAEIFLQAKETGLPVLLRKTVVHESETPLRDGENDMVDVCTYAMPDGTTSTKYVHNY